MIRNYTTLNRGNNGSSHSTSILDPQRTVYTSAPHLQFNTTTLPMSLCLPSTMVHRTIRYRNPLQSPLRRLSTHPPILPNFPTRPFPAPAAIPTIDNITSQVLKMPLARESRRWPIHPILQRQFRTHTHHLPFPISCQNLARHLITARRFQYPQ